MKKILTVFSLALLAIAAQAKVIVIDPGHGTYTANDRPAATISYPNLSNGMPAKDVGFYESNTNLWKAEALKDHLVAAGHTVHMTREKNGTNPGLSTRAALATSKSAYVFISIHSNASSNGDYINYLYLALSGHSGVASSTTTAQKKVATACWPYIFDFMGDKNATGGYVHEWPSHYTYTNTKIAKQSLGVMRHARPGFLSEGFFHTYHPSRHRALNKDWCRQEGVRYFRGIQAYCGATAETNGDIMGVLKRSDKTMTNSKTLREGQFSYTTKSTHDKFYPCNGATVYLYNGTKTKLLKTYKVDNNWNGVFVFENLDPGTYYLGAKYSGCGNVPESYRKVTVKANTTVYPVVLIKSGTFSQTTEDAYTSGGSTSTTPSLKASATTVNLSAAKGATAPAMALTITGANLTADMTITNSSSVITHKTSSWNARTGGTLTISCPTTTVGTYTATITVKSGSTSVEIDVAAVIQDVQADVNLNEGTITFKQEWVKTITSGATWMKKDNNNNRSIAYYNGSLYVPDHVNGKFHVVNATSGELVSTQTLTSTGSYLHFNLRITDDGKMLLGNTNAGTKETATVEVVTSNLSSGGQESLGTGLLSGRSDYFYPYGKWNESGYLIAIANDIIPVAGDDSTAAFVKIPYSGGKLGTSTLITNSALPVVAASAKVIPADANSFYASAIGIEPTKHDLATGNLIDAFGEAKPVQDENANTSGLGLFEIHGHKYMITPLSRYGKFEIYDISNGLAKAQKVAAVGTTANIGTNGNGAVTVDFDTYVSGNDVFIYELVPNNGIAKYKFTFTPSNSSTVNPPVTEQTTPDATYGNVKFFLQGGTLNVPAADNAALWELFKPAFNTYMGTNRADQKLDGTTANPVSTFMTVSNKDPRTFLLNANSDWKWLGDYIIETTKSGSNPITTATDEAYWRYETQGFFMAVNITTQSTGYHSYIKNDWSVAGTPVAWKPFYMFTHKPTKTNDVFLGWYDNAYANGSPLTKLPTSGNVYACWKNTPVTTAVDDVQQEARILPTFSGVEMFFEGTQTIAVYNINGMMVASGVSTDYYTCDLGTGMYVIRIGNKAYKFVK